MPRRLLRDGVIVGDDWRHLDADCAAPDANVIVPFARWQSDRDSWIARGGRLGVQLAPADPVEALARDLPHLSLVAIDFPAVNEGRGYTQARLLRERWRFTDELRATGCVRRDQVFFLARCGCNAFEVPEHELEGARAAFSTFSAAYQASNDAGLNLKLHHRR